MPAGDGSKAGPGQLGMAVLSLSLSLSERSGARRRRPSPSSWQPPANREDLAGARDGGEAEPLELDLVELSCEGRRGQIDNTCPFLP